MKPLPKVWLVSWFIMLFVVCLLLGERSVRAVTGCDSGVNPWGFTYSHICWSNYACTPDTCERDRCISSTCGNGYQEYCVSPSYCGIYLACYTWCP